MNNKELQAARKGLFLDITEAAEHVGGVSVRTWQRWEKGDFSIPDDVKEKMHQLCEKRMQFIDVLDVILQENPNDVLDFDYYQTLIEYNMEHEDATIVDWRISQSVAAYYLLEGSATFK